MKLIREIAILFLAICLLLTIVSCRERVSEQVEESTEEQKATGEMDRTDPGGPITREEVSFEYDEESLYASISAADAQEELPPRILAPNYTLYALSYRSDGEDIPGWVTIPTELRNSYPVVLMLHGHRASKDMMTRRYAALLAAEGIASIAIDLPLQGARTREGEEFFSGDPETTAGTIRQAVIDTRRLIDYLDEVIYFDSERVGIIGYSLGSWIAVMSAAADERIDAVALNVMGEGTTAAVNGEWTDIVEDHPLLERMLERRGADISEGAYQGMLIEKWIAGISPRPILMLNGREDRIVPTEGVEALYEAAGEPKEIVWYEVGHILPREANEYCVEWIAEELER